jgi:hypothetical protein
MNLIYNTYINRIRWDHILQKGFCRRLIGFISLIFLLLNSCNKNVYGQSSDTLQENLINHQLWIDIYPHFYINEKLEYYGDAGYRTMLNEKSWNRIYARPSIRYHFNKNWDVHGGLGLFYIFDKYDIHRFEITPWQGIQLNWPKTTYIGFKHLAKIEERLSYNTSDWELSIDLRFRYKLSGKVILCTDCSLQNVYIPFYGEIFLPVNDDIDEFYRNRGRAGIGLGYNASKDWRFSVIMNWQTSKAGPEEKIAVSDYAYQLKIIKRWKSRLLKIK